MADDLDPAAVERAARAGYDASRDAAETEAWDDLPEWGRETLRAFTRAALAAAGPLVTPEHDAQVAARAWDEGFTRGFYAAQVMPRDADASESTIPNPYEQEGDR